jgi:transposase
MVPIPAETARVAHAAFPKGTLCLQIRDTLGPLYADAQFAALFSPTGQPAEAPARLALVLILQCAENLSDRQAADAVRGRIDWKYALGLELTDPGFDASVLSEFRTRLVHGGAEAFLLEPLLRQLEAHDLLKARGTQRTDSTHILAAIRTLNRLELVGEAMRYALNRLAVAAPAWLQAHLHPTWGERYGHRVENYRLPKAETERQQLAAAIGADGFTLLRAAYAPEAPPAVREAPAVEVLRQIWVQQYYGPDDPPRWRQEPDVPPAAQLIHSPYDLDARYSLQHGSAWVGYKAHATETCDDDTPHVITHVETTPATRPKYSEATIRGNIVPPRCFIDMFCSCFYETGRVLRRHGRYGSVNTLPKMIAEARDVSRHNSLFCLILLLITLPKKSAFGKVTWTGKRRLLPQMTASLYLGRPRRMTTC